MTKRLYGLAASAICIAAMLWRAGAGTLEEGFLQPPDSTKPSCYWYWISDNISREGITRDLEAMKEAGIGEAFIGNIYLDDLKIGKVKALTEEWWSMIEHAIREGGRIGVKVGMFNCPGWSQSGGPWIKPSQAMRFVAITEERITGPANFSAKLKPAGKDFQDIALLAFPTPESERQSPAAPKVSASVPVSNLEALVDGKTDTGIGLPRQQFHIDFNFEEPITARSLLLVPERKNFFMQCELLAEKDGKLVKIREFPFDRSNNQVSVGFVPYAPLTISFPAVTAGKFRLAFRGVQQSPGLLEARISPEPRIERYVEKQLGKMHPTPLPMWGDYSWPATAEPDDRALTVAPGSVQDLTGKLKPDGTLEWQAPKGEWVLLRCGMIPTGIKNAPASPEGQGLEVDKMNRQAAKAHFDAYIGKIIARIPERDRKAFERVIADSYEMGAQNWTDGLRERFRERFGYDPQPWLPALTGRIVGSADESDRFLWDLRRLVADQVAYDYVGGLRDACHEHGLKLWLENYGHWGFPAEFLQYGGQSDELGGEFWSSGNLGSIELRAASSAAHIYGKPRVSAEAFTSTAKFESLPWDLKRRGDWALTEGINHWVLHVYIHQPWEDKLPGVNAWFSTEFNRHNPWFRPGREFIDYYRRSQFLLQQGRHVADVAYFIGEDTPKMTGIQHPSLPAGYNYDYINAEVIQSRLEVNDGAFVLPDGMSYRVLALPPVDTMRPGLLAKIVALVKQGGTVLGDPPLHSPSLQDYPNADAKVKELAAELWGQCDGQKVKSARVGKGRVFRNMALKDVFAELAVAPQFRTDAKGVLWTHRSGSEGDVYFLSNQGDAPARFTAEFRTGGRTPEFWDAVSKKIIRPALYSIDGSLTKLPIDLEGRGSIFVVFREAPPRTGFLSEIRKNGRAIISADKGPLLDEALPGGGTNTHTLGTLPIMAKNNGDQLLAEVTEAGEYVFVSSDGKERALSIPSIPASMQIDGPWKLSFPKGRDVPNTIEMKSLLSLSKHENTAVRHFSGTVTYACEFKAEPVTGDALVWLDLGAVEGVAEVRINDGPEVVLWSPPYVADVTRLFRPGSNKLEVRISGTWRNRLVGDAKYPNGFPGADGLVKPLEFKPFLTANLGFKGQEPLSAFGLLGPVRLVYGTQVPVR